jgi:ribonucleoside-diphosphate reductase beta chain
MDAGEIVHFEGSKPGTRSNLQIFTPSRTDNSVALSYYSVYEPQSQTKEANAPLLFRLPPHQSYVDLNDSYLYLKCRILDSSGNKILATDLCAPSHMAFHTAFSDLVISINGHPVSNSQGHYPFQALMIQTLGSSAGEKATRLSSILYYEDETADTFTLAGNKGFKARQALAAESKYFEMIGKPYSSLWNNGNYLPNDITIEMTFTRSKPEFGVDSASTTKKFYMEIDTARLYCRHHLLSRETLAQRNKSFSRGNATYQLTEAETRVCHVSKGALSFTSDALFSKIPSYILIGMISTKAYVGSYDKSCQNFQNFKVSSVTIRSDRDTFLHRNIQLDFDNNLYLSAYHTLMQALSPGRPLDNGIDRESYKNSKNLLLFTLPPTPTSSSNFVITYGGHVLLRKKLL